MKIQRLENDEPAVRASIGVSLGRAFQEEPNFAYMVPDPSRRRRGLSWFFGSFVTRLGLRLGAVDVAGDGDGAAIWLRPGASVGLTAAVAAGMLMMPVHLGWTGVVRSQRLAAAVEAERSRLMPGRHWYLMALGVAPEHQGRGLGRMLLEAGLARADRVGEPCYLETFRPSTAEFYARHGFEVLAERRVEESGPVFYAMARPISA